MNKKIPQKRDICKIIKDESAFNQLKRNRYKDIGLTKSSIDYELEMHQNKKKTLKLRYRNLQMRKDHSKITRLLMTIIVLTALNAERKNL